MARVPITAEAKKKSYYSFYERPLAPIDPSKSAVLDTTCNLAEAMKIENRAKLLEPGYLPGEIGFWAMEDGSLHVANRTYMKDITGEMLYWWFAWHPLESFRYTIWENEDHYSATLSDEDHKKISNPTVPLVEKTRDVTHHVLESMVAGEKPAKIQLQFKQPKAFGYDIEGRPESEVCFLICANCITKVGPLTFTTAMTHMARNVEGGVELRSRFWMGKQIIDGQVKNTIPFMIKKLPIENAKKLFGHNIKEYANLTAILPELYAQEKDNW